MQTLLNGALDPWGIRAELDQSGDNYGAVAKIEREDGATCYAQLMLTDSSDAGDDEAGKEGNYMLEIIADGGLVLGMFSPHNYTDMCWADYSNEGEWHTKRLMLEQAEPGIREVITNFMEVTKGG